MLWQETATVKEAERPKLTKIIERAVREVFIEVDNQQAVQLLWKIMSGDAHALGWPVVLRGRDWTRESDGLGSAKPGEDLVDIVHPYIASSRLLRRGWSLFDCRAEGN